MEETFKNWYLISSMTAYLPCVYASKFDARVHVCIDWHDLGVKGRGKGIISSLFGSKKSAKGKKVKKGFKSATIDN
eukprot:1354953-Amorphochlora_amoeboformis.AAC.2